MSGKTYAIILTLIVLIVGTSFYFTAINNPKEINIKPQEQMLSNENSIPENNPEKSTDSESSSEVKTQNFPSLFNHILQEDRIFIKKDVNGSIKLFYFYVGDEKTDIQLQEGDIDNYEIHTIGGQNYYPLILGYEEAKRMREEELFNNIGDPIKSFYGRNVVVIGVMKKLDNAFDVIHITPLKSIDLN